MKWMLMATIFFSCSTYQSTRKKEIERRWLILERAIEDRWTQKEIVNLLGSPESKDRDKEDESWSYSSEESGVQEWSISFNLKSKIVSYISYGPTGSLDNDFTLDKILKRWESLNCKKKKSKMYTRGHTVYQDQYYLCDGNKRIDYNRYNEVSWIRVSSGR
ncbi:MAG: hypothetical protein ACPGJV_08645 [Bacteriovoracaceae bacterium]